MPFSTLRENDFRGRQEELAALSARVLQADAGAAQSAVLTGPRGIGKTELLKQLFGLLFWKQDRVAPFYYSANPALLSASAFSKSYLTRFLCHRLAFEKKEQSLLYSEGMSLDGLSALVKDRGAAWAKELIDQYERNAGDPVSALRIALAAPHRSALATGTPVAVLIDEFHRLKGLSLDGVADQQLVSLFEETLFHGKTPHVIAGNAAEVHEMPVTNRLERVPLRPLGFAEASARVLSLARPGGAEGNVLPAPPLLLLRRLGGNPFYLGCIGKAVRAEKELDDKDFWNAYIREIMEGTLLLSWSTVLKSFFPDLGLRKTALAVIHKIHHAGGPLSCRQVAASFALTDGVAETVAESLYLAGFIQGEFGVLRPVEDLVLRDIIDCLYLKELLTTASHDLEQELREKLLPEKAEAVRFDLTLPMAGEAELVAAQAIEQFGKNLRLDPDAVGQLQIAVIEACINAIEHSKGTERKLYVGVVAEGDRLEVSVESAGQEFIVQETGEPFGGGDTAKTSGRGWGIKLMKRFADDVRFEKTARGTKTVLIKQLNQSVRAQKEGRTNRE